MTYFRQHPPARGDVIVYRLPTDPSTIYVKPDRALAGDRVVFREGRAFVNGAAMAEPYIKAGDPRSAFNNTQEFTVPGAACVRAGDNRANSTDSRVSTHGFVPMGNIIGRASEIFWSNAGWAGQGCGWIRRMRYRLLNLIGPIDCHRNVNVQLLVACLSARSNVLRRWRRWPKRTFRTFLINFRNERATRCC
jgi:signal peptidase I